MSSITESVKRLDEDSTATEAADWLDDHLPDQLPGDIDIDIRYGTENGVTYFQIGDGERFSSHRPAFAAYDAFVDFQSKGQSTKG